MEFIRWAKTNMFYRRLALWTSASQICFLIQKKKKKNQNFHVQLIVLSVRYNSGGNKSWKVMCFSIKTF